MHVLILGARAPACLEWARAFNTAGWRVTTGDSMRWPVSRFCKASNHYIRLPEPRTRTTDWLEAIRLAVIRHQIDLVLPTCEEAFYLAYGQAQLPCKVLTSDFELMHRLHHKGRFAELVRGWPVQTPETRLLQTPVAPGQFANSTDWVFKPAYSRFARQTLLQPAQHQLRTISPTAQQPWVAQRFVAGQEHCSFSLLVNGKLTAHAVYKPRYRVGRGSGIWFEPVDAHPIKAFVEHLGANTGYTGQIAFDYIQDCDGTFHVLECNPRATSGVHLFDDQGTALVNALLGANTLLTPSTRPRQVALAMLLFAAPRNALRRQFWRDFREARDVTTRPEDIGPLMAQIPALAEIIWRALRGRYGLLAAATADIEWDGLPMEQRE